MKKFFSSSVVLILSITSLVFISLVGSVVLLFIPATFHTTFRFLIMALVQVANVFIVVKIRKLYKFVSPYMPKRPTVKTCIKSVALGVITFVGMYLISQYVFVFFEHLGAKPSYLDISGWYIIPAIIITVILAPIGEEAVFRCSLTFGLDNGKRGFAIVMSALFFALMHMSPLQSFYQFFLGVMLAVLIERTSNVIYPIIAHASSNLVVIILSCFPTPSIPLFNPLTIILAVLVLALCFMLVFIIVRSIPKTEKVISEEVTKESTGEKVISVSCCALAVMVCLVFWISAFF